MALLNPSDFLVRVAKGDVPGHVLRNATGTNQDVDLAKETIWTPGGTYTFPTAAQTMSIVSTSALDTLAGTGARVVRIEGLDGSGIVVFEDVNLNGIVPVVTTQAFRRVNSFAVLAAGALEFAQGTITAIGTTDLTVVHAQIEAGTNAAQQFVFTVPAAKRAIFVHALAGSLRDSASNANVEFTIRYRPFGGVWYETVPFTTNLSGDSYLSIPLLGGITWTAQTDIIGMAISSQTNSDVSGLVQVLLVDDGA